MSKLLRKKIIGSAVITLALSAGIATNANAQVRRLSGPDRYSTSDAIVKEGWETGSSTAILASGLDANTVDALTVAPLAKKYNAPVVLVNPKDSVTNIVAKFKALNAKTVYIANGTGVISTKVQDALKANGISTVYRLGGATRYETALNIAKALGASSNSIVIANGDDAHLVDSLSIAPIAAAKGMPIFLAGSSIDAATTTYINSLGIKTTYVLGGTSVVSDAAVSKLPGLNRLSGSGRYETNAKVVDTFKEDVALNLNNIFIASGEDANLIDSLAGAPLAASKGAPIIFVHDTINSAVSTLLKSVVNETTKTYGLGGTGAVTVAATDSINKIQTDAVAANSNISITSISAVNGKLTITLKSLPQFPLKAGDFAITQKIDNGLVTTVVPTASTLDLQTNITFTLPAVAATSVEQNVVYSVAYKNNTPVSSAVVKVPKLANLEVQSVSALEVKKNIGDAYTLPATVVATLSDGTTKELAVTWDKSPDTKVAGVFTFTGKLTLVSGVVNSKDITATAKLTIGDSIAPIVKVSTVSLNKTTDSLSIGQTDTLIATVSPSDSSNKSVIWTSSNPAIATVDDTGKVTAVGEGIATITATTVDGNKKAVCTVLTKMEYFPRLSDLPKPAGVSFQTSYNRDWTVVTYSYYSFDFDAYTKLLIANGWKYTVTEYTGFTNDFYFVKNKHLIAIKIEQGGHNYTLITGDVH